MDQTDFSLLLGLLVGSNLGAHGLQWFTEWSLWICYPTGGLVGLLAFATFTYVAIAWIGGRTERKDKDNDGV